MTHRRRSDPKPHAPHAYVDVAAKGRDLQQARRVRRRVLWCPGRKHGNG